MNSNTAVKEVIASAQYQSQEIDTQKNNSRLIGMNEISVIEDEKGYYSQFHVDRNHMKMKQVQQDYIEKPKIISGYESKSGRSQNDTSDIDVASE